MITFAACVVPSRRSRYRFVAWRPETRADMDIVVIAAAARRHRRHRRVIIDAAAVKYAGESHRPGCERCFIFFVGVIFFFFFLRGRDEPSAGEIRGTRRSYRFVETSVRRGVPSKNGLSKTTHSELVFEGLSIFRSELQFRFSPTPEEWSGSPRRFPHTDKYNLRFPERGVRRGLLGQIRVFSFPKSYPGSFSEKFQQFFKKIQAVDFRREVLRNRVFVSPWKTSNRPRVVRVEQNERAMAGFTYTSIRFVLILYRCHLSKLLTIVQHLILRGFETLVITNIFEKLSKFFLRNY